MSSQLLDNYLAGANPSHRKGLRLLHDTIMSCVPQAELVTRRGVPAFRYRGRTLVSIGDARNHVSLYIMRGSVIANHAELLRAFDASRTVVRFHPEQIATSLVIQLVGARAAELEEVST